MTEPDAPTPDDGLGLARDIAKSYRGKGSPVPPSAKRRVRPAKPGRATRDEPSLLADLLGEVVNDQGWDERLAAQRVFTDWAGIVGPEVAQHSEVIAFDDGEVEVRTDSTAWATQLRVAGTTHRGQAQRADGRRIGAPHRRARTTGAVMEEGPSLDPRCQRPEGHLRVGPALLVEVRSELCERNLETTIAVVSRLRFATHLNHRDLLSW